MHVEISGVSACCVGQFKHSDSMATEFSRTVTQATVAQIAETTGFDSMQQSALDILSDLLLRYIGEIGATAHSYAELSHRAAPSADDLLMAFKELGIKVEDILAYTNAQEEVPFAHTMPPYPMQRTPKWPPTFAQRKEDPPKHMPAWLPALPDKHTYMSTPSFAGHDTDAKRQRLAANKAKRQAEKSLVRLSERMGTAPGAEVAAAPGGNPFLAAPTWEAASAAAAADERPDGGAVSSGQSPVTADVQMEDAPQQGDLADAFAAAAAGGGERQQRQQAQPSGSWAEAAAAPRPSDALGGLLPTFPLDWAASGGRLHTPLPDFSEADDAFTVAEEAGAAAAAEARAKATGRRGTGRGRAMPRDAASERAKAILAAGADAVLTLGEDRDAPGGRDSEAL